MPTQQQQSIANKLKRESEHIAQLAAKGMFSGWSGDAALAGQATAGPFRFLPAEKDAPDTHAQEVGADEMLSMMQDGFRRLGGVVALSVLVDEPGLIVDDMQWLKRLFAARHVEPGHPKWLEHLLQSYLHAAASVLSSSEVLQVEDVVNRALAGLTKLESDPPPSG